MNYLHVLLWAYFIGYPVYIYCTHEQEKQSVISGSISRITVYKLTMLYLWLPTILLLFLAMTSTNELSLLGLGFKWQWSNINLILVSLTCAFTLFLAMQIKSFRQDNQQQEKYIEQLAFIRWFMPENISQARYFILGVSVSAGICEELLYRGYLLNLLAETMPNYLAVIVSSLLFGAGHIYQGLSHVFRSAMFGVILSIIYLLTDSIYLVIFLHIFLDMYSGVMSYICISSKNKLQSTLTASD